MSLNERITNDINEKWSIKCLPYKIQSEPRPCSDINGIILRLEKKHNDLICEMTSKLAEVNTEIKNDIRLKSDAIKQDLIRFRQYGPKILNQLEFDHENALCYDVRKITQSKKYCFKLLKISRKKICEFYKSLLYLEQNRSKQFKDVYKEYYNKLLSVCFKLPHDVQLYFENRLLHTNQMLLSNLRCYEDLKLKLTLEMDNDVKLLVYKIEKSAYEWGTLSKNEIEINFKYLHYKHPLLEDLVRRKLQTGIIEKWFNKYQNKILDWLRTAAPSSKVDSDVWREYIFRILGDLDVKMNKLIEIYNVCNEELYAIQSDKIDECLRIIARENVVCVADVVEFKETTLKPLNCAWQRALQQEILGFQAYWQTTIENTHKKVNFVYDLLQDYSRVFAAAAKKLGDFKKHDEKDIAKAVNKQNKLLQKKYKKLNVRCNKLRQEKNEKTLAKSLSKVKKFLGKIQKSIHGSRQKEINVIQKHYVHDKKCSDLLKSALKSFVQKSQKKKEKEMKNSELCNQEIVEPSILCTYTKRFGLLPKAMDLWKQKLWESTAQYVTMCSEEHHQKAIKWTEQYLDMAEQRFKERTQMNEEQYPRIKLEIHDVRLAEIKEHLWELERHKKEIDGCISAAKYKLPFFEKDNINRTDESLKALKDIQQKSLESKNWLTALSYMQQGKFVYNQHHKNTEEFYRSFTEMFKSQVNDILEENASMNKNALLFSQGGNFNKKEAAVYRKKLNTYKSLLNKKQGEIIKSIVNSQFSIKKKFDLEANKCVENINNVNDIHKFQENYGESVSKLKENIKKEVYFMKYQIKKISDIVDNMSGTFEKIEQVENNTENTKRFISGLRDYFVTVRNYLQFTDEQKIKKILLVEDNPARVSSPKKSDRKSPTKRSKTPQKSITGNHHDLLFKNTTPTKEDNFLTKIFNLLFNFSRLTQNISESYYSKHIRSESYNIKVMNSGDFCKETISKVKNYFLQCCEAWLKQIEVYMELVSRYQKGICKFSEMEVMKYHNQSKRVINLEHAKVLVLAKCEFNKGKSNVKKLHDKLKSLFGYIKNQWNLKTLDEQMTVLIEQLKQKLQDIVSPFEEIEYQALPYENEMSTVIEQFKNIRETVNDDYLTIFLTEQSTIVNSLLYKVYETNSSSLPEIFPMHRLTFDQSNEIGYPDQIESDIDERSNILTNELNFALEILTQNYQDSLELFKNEVKEYKSKCLDEIDTLYQIWKIDISKIMTLYSVKYE